MSLVKSLARKLRERAPEHIGMDELLAYGSKGLVEAAERYDPTRGVAFSTFAYYRVRGAMFDGIRLMGGIPKAVAKRHRAAAMTDEYLENAQQREAGADPAARARASTADTLRSISDRIAGVTTITLISLDSDRPFDVPDERATEAMERAGNTWLTSRIGEALEQLPPKERRILEDCYYGDLTIKEAGERQGMSRSWACRLHSRAIEMLGEALGVSQQG